MKIVQTVLREADRNRLLDALACDILYDTQLLLELKNRSIVDIQEAYRNHMNTFVEYLLRKQKRGYEGLLANMQGERK